MKQTYQEEKSHCENKVLIYVGKKIEERYRVFLLFQITQK